MFSCRQWQLSFSILPIETEEERKHVSVLSIRAPLSAPPKMSQRTLGFFLVPKVAAEERENDDGEEGREAGEEDAVEVSSDDESNGGDERGIEHQHRVLLPLAPLEDNNAQQQQQHTRGTWSIPQHLKSRQIGRPRAKRPMVASRRKAPSRRRPSFASTSTSSFSTPARHRAATASAAARSLRPANVSLPLVVEAPVASIAAFPAAASVGAEMTTTATAAASLVRRRDWRVSDLRFDGRTGELLAVALRGPGSVSPEDSDRVMRHQGELQLFSDSSLRASLSACPFPTFRRRRDREDSETEDEGDDEPPRRDRTGDLTPLATVRFPEGPLLELAWDCGEGGIAGGGGGGSDVVAALVGGSRLSGGTLASSSFAAASGSRRYPSGALALFDLDDEAIFCSSVDGGESANLRYATAVIEPPSSSSSSSLSSSSATLAFRSSAISLAAAAPSWTTLCPTTVSSAFAVGDAAGKVHLWDRRASLKRPVGMLSSGGASSSFSSAAAVAGGGGGSSSICASFSSLRSLALLADGQTLVGGCSDGTLRLWDVRACLGGDGTREIGERAGGVVSLGGGGGDSSLASSRRCHASSSSASDIRGALPAARGCLRSAVRAVPGVNALLAGTPENDFADAVPLGGVSLLCPHPTDAARLGFRLDCGWNGSYVIGGREDERDGSGELGGDGVGAVSHLHAPPVIAASSSSSTDASSSASRLLLLRGGPGARPPPRRASSSPGRSQARRLLLLPGGRLPRRSPSSTASTPARPRPRRPGTTARARATMKEAPPTAPLRRPSLPLCTSRSLQRRPRRL